MPTHRAPETAPVRVVPGRDDDEVVAALRDPARLRLAFAEALRDEGGTVHEVREA